MEAGGQCGSASGPRSSHGQKGENECRRKKIRSGCRSWERCVWRSCVGTNLETLEAGAARCSCAELLTNKAKAGAMELRQGWHVRGSSLPRSARRRRAGATSTTAPGLRRTRHPASHSRYTQYCLHSTSFSPQLLPPAPAPDPAQHVLPTFVGDGVAANHLAKRGRPAVRRRPRVPRLRFETRRRPLCPDERCRPPRVGNGETGHLARDAQSAGARQNSRGRDVGQVQGDWRAAEEVDDLAGCRGMDPALLRVQRAANRHSRRSASPSQSSAASSRRPSPSSSSSSARRLRRRRHPTQLRELPCRMRPRRPRSEAVSSKNISRNSCA